MVLFFSGWEPHLNTVLLANLEVEPQLSSCSSLLQNCTSPPNGFGLRAGGGIGKTPRPVQQGGTPKNAKNSQLEAPEAVFWHFLEGPCAGRRIDIRGLRKSCGKIAETVEKNAKKSVIKL